MLCRNLGRRENERWKGENARDKKPFGRPIFAPVPSSVRLHFPNCTLARSIIRALRRSSDGEEDHTHLIDSSSEADFEEAALPSIRSRGDGCLALEFGAYILGLIGHGIRANKHRSRSGIGMHAVSNGSELHSDFK